MTARGAAMLGQSALASIGADQAAWIDDTGFARRLAAELVRARRRSRPVMLSLSRPLGPREDPLPLIARARASGLPVALWECPAEGVTLAAVGAAWTATAHGAERFRRLAAARDALLAEAVVDAVDQPLFFTAGAFADDVRRRGPWAGFPAARLLLPRLVLARRAGAAALTVNGLAEPGAAPDGVAERMLGPLAWLETEGPPAAPVDDPAARYRVSAAPPTAAWTRAVTATVADIDRGRFDKLVLARTCRIEATRPFDCAAAVARLRVAYPTCTTFWIGTPAGDFIGATPEILLRLGDGVLHTAAVAGSIAPGTSPAADAAQARALLASDKDRREHALVVDAIATALRPLCARLEVAPAPDVLRLHNVRHLRTPIRGELSGERGRGAPCALALVDCLHPTPAVAGHPRSAALAALAAREPFDRGWYAGPIGWLDARGDGEIAVAIRSALVRGSRATLYAGAGIVAGSDPEAELAETRIKLQPLLAALMEV